MGGEVGAAGLLGAQDGVAEGAAVDGVVVVVDEGEGEVGGRDLVADSDALGQAVGISGGGGAAVRGGAMGWNAWLEGALGLFEQ